MSDASQTNADTAGGRAPPYVSFQTFLTMIEDLKVNGLPPQIDRSVLKRFSGGVGSQLLAALRSLALIDDANRPRPTLDKLVDAHGTEAFKGLLRGVIIAGYPFLTKLDLKTATPSMFAEAFKNGTQARDDVLRKCRTFYLHAAKHVGIELGPRLSSGGAIPRAPAGSSAGRRKGKGRRSLPDDMMLGGNVTPPAAHIERLPASYQDKLLEKFPTFDPAWPDDLKSKWFEGFQKLLSNSPEEAETSQK